MSEIRIRNVATLVYPESAPDGWQSILSDLHIPAFISPLHDRDDRKSHYHVLLMFPSLKSRNQCSDYIQSFGGVGCEAIASLRSYARYLCHLDNPDKAQYNPKDVIALSGAQYDDLIVDRKKAKYDHLVDIFKLCRDNNILSFAYLLDYLAQYNREDFSYVIDNAYVIREYLKSLSWEYTTRNQLKADAKKYKDNPFIDT